MDYQETLDWLFGLEAKGIKFGLDNISRLLEKMGDPHNEFRSIHVGGTNGKGSVCALLNNVLRAHGYRVGMYTSPHIVDFGERIQVDGKPLEPSEMLRLAEELRSLYGELASEGRKMSFFELTTAMAFRYFQEKGVEWAVVEVGMGGRLDATNVIVPECSVITRIGIEHTEYLGRTVNEIAYEKAGIIKPGLPVITAARPDQGLEEIRRRASELGAQLTVIDESFYKIIESNLDGTTIRTSDDLTLFAPLPGSFQGENMALAYAALKTLLGKGVRLDELSIVRGFARTHWPGRLETLRRKPRVIVDATHTADGARVIATELKRNVRGSIILVLGVLKDKDLQGIVEALGPLASIAIATSPRTKRAFPAIEVERELRCRCRTVLRVEGVGEALREALRLASEDDTVLVTGSLYTLGEAMNWWKSNERC